MNCSECPESLGHPRTPFTPWCDHPCGEWIADEIDRETDHAKG